MKTTNRTAWSKVTHRLYDKSCWVLGRIWLHAGNILHQTDVAIHKVRKAERDGEAVVAVSDVN